MNLNSLPAGVRLAVEAAQNKKAADVVVLDLAGLGAFTEHFVICTAFSPRQAQAVSNEIEEQLAGIGRSPQHREGSATAEWVLLDFGAFLVHVFSEAARRYYDLVWRSARRLEFPGEPAGAGRRTSEDDHEPLQRGLRASASEL
jgi:ribosome-associated protein